MEIIIERDYAAMCDRAASVVREALAAKPDLVLGLATGKTPVGLYERLRTSPGSFAKVRFFNLDELHGRGPKHPDSFHAFLVGHLLKHVTHEESNVHLLRGDTEDLEEASRRCEEEIVRVGGVDLQLLGIGGNGHIGFNEPGSSLGSRTRPKTLEPQTLQAYMSGLDPASPVSNFAITMGIGTILDARHLLMMASGEGKAEVIRQMVEGPVTAELPASALQLHRRVTVVLDEAAAHRLKRIDYYKWVFENKWRVGQK